MPWPWEISSNEPFPDEFPGYELVDEGEAQILVGKPGVLKVYKPEYSEQAIRFYAEVTNKLAGIFDGRNIDVAFPNGADHSFALSVNPVTEIGQMKNGRMFTKGSFIAGPHLEEQLSQSIRMGANNWISRQLVEFRYDLPYILKDTTQNVLLEQLTGNEQRAVNMHMRNMKVYGDGINNRIIVTDPSASIRDLI